MTARKHHAPSTWSVVEAKARLDDVIEEAEEAGPQEIARNADDQALVVPVEEWAPEPRRRGTLAEFFHNSPLRGSGIDLERHPDTVFNMRKYDLFDPTIGPDQDDAPDHRT